MNTKHILYLILAGGIVLSLALGFYQPAEANNADKSPTPGKSRFVTVLQPGVWQKHVLGACSAEGGYVVDISPLVKANDGTHIEHKVLPEFDGEQWNDVLWILMPEENHPIAVKVNVYSTAGWPVIWRADLELTAEWNGYVVRDSSERGAYIVEINPYEPGIPGDAVAKALVEPEFPWGSWVDVLRIQLPEGQAPLWADVAIYSQPDPIASMEIETTVFPEDWQGFILGPSNLEQAYLVEIDPLLAEGTWLEKFTIQPEFDGEQWNDVLRLFVPGGDPPFPALPLIARIYTVR